MRIATALGTWRALTAVAIAGAALFWLRGDGRAARILIAATLGAALVENLLKVAVRRPRPEPYFGTPLPASYAFPSGHALDSLVVYGTLAVLVARHIERRAARLWLLFGLVVLVGLIGVSRIYLGVHWPTDVLGGWVVGAAWLALVVAFTRRRANALSPDGTQG
jgi:undecaprenyl-diphosphatase